MKLLIFGQTGQVARELARLVPEAQFLGRAQADLADPAACAAIIRGSDADAVINAAAYTAVDRSESEQALAGLVNGEAPAAMARAAAERRVPFLHLSTDYVFDGAGDRPFRPDDQTGPLNAYGRSKLAGELGIRAADGNHLILRTSWIFSAHGANFVKTMLRLGGERESLMVVSDQIGGPTPAAAVARTLISLAMTLRDGATGGTRHCAGWPDTSWAGFAREIMHQARLACRIEDIPTAAYPTPARRPLNSRLDCSTLGLPRPDWHEGLSNVLKELRQ